MMPLAEAYLYFLQSVLLGAVMVAEAILAQQELRVVQVAVVVVLLIPQAQEIRLQVPLVKETLEE
ncbi:MAG: hypothetical protein EBS91_09470 [Betaproteobacteria bacterium]|nr:hypothetical protein [Betaproteobacteria bacterium]NCA24810.1 hypothetical protein [Betaproteobacteria bacterium]